MATTITHTVTMSPEDVIAYAVNSIVGRRWRVETQGPRNVVFVRDENKFKFGNLLVIGCATVFFVIPGLIFLAILALRQPRIEARITLTATQETGTTTILAQMQGGGAEARVQQFLASLPEAPGAAASPLLALPAASQFESPLAVVDELPDLEEGRPSGRFRLGFLDSFKKGARRTERETDKLVRINPIQTEIANLRLDSRKRITEMGDKALDLYRAEALSEAELIILCEGIIALEKEIVDKEAQIEAIKRETLLEEAGVTPATYGHICANCKIMLPDEAVYCPQCGSKAVDIPPPTPVSVAVTCANCGSSLAAGAKFCPECGTKVEKKPETVEAPHTLCPECQSPLTEEATFCANCGTQTKKEEALLSEVIPAPLIGEAEPAENPLGSLEEPIKATSMPAEEVS